MLARLDVGADARLFHLVIDDNLVGIAIQRHAMSKLIFGRNDNLFATRELDRALGCTTVRVELAYGKLRERDDWPTGRDDSDTIPIRRLKSYGRSVVTPCGSIVVSCKLYSQLCNPGDEVQTRFSLSVAVHHDKRDRALLTDEGDADRIFCSARYAVGQQGYGMLCNRKGAVTASR